MCTPDAKWPLGQGIGIELKRKEIQLSPDFLTSDLYEKFTRFMSFLDIAEEILRVNRRAKPVDSFLWVDGRKVRSFI
jgi:hypothetical protein